MNTRTVDTLIIGAGISGIGAAIKLMEQGIYDFQIVEKHPEVGGTWRDNTYPGCECDVPSALYSYSFEPNPNWSRVFAGQAEIQDYVKRTASKYKVAPRIHFNTSVEQLRWQAKDKHWQVDTTQGRYLANKVISCTGYLHEPIIPNIPGMESFNGELFHSSRWNHDCDLSGKRVAVIGTGASAIQFIPKIQPQAGKLHVFQRTPQWILPKANFSISALGQALLKAPLSHTGFRGLLYSQMEAFGLGFRHPNILKQVQKVAERHIHSKIKDPELRAKLTPDYTLGCKRVLLSNDYYPALAQDNVDVYNTGVARIEGNTIIGQDGSRCEADIIILGTGFHVSDVSHSNNVIGASGKSLADIWQGSPEAYRGTTISDFPNFFLVLGPNLAIGHNSAFIVIEAQLKYIMGAIREMRDRQIEHMEVTGEAQRKYNEHIQEALQNTVWNTGGCSSYYLDANGKNSIGFPWGTLKMKELLNRFDVESYTPS